MYGAKIKRKSANPGIGTPATIGWNIGKSSCNPKKYHGAFDGFGVSLKLASSNKGGFTNIEKITVNAVIANAATNSTIRRCGQTWTLSTGLSFTS